MKRSASEKLLWIGAGSVAGYFLAEQIIRKIVNQKIDKYSKIIMEDDYKENLLELLSAMTRLGPQLIFETDMRATKGKPILRPLGTIRKFPSLDQLMLNPVQLTKMPTQLATRVDTGVTIGPRAQKPLKISMPVMIAPMAYGTALSEKFKIALAKGASLAGTAICNGQGPYLPSEHKAAKKYIYQYHRGSWGKTPEIIASSDAVEIQFGQGAIGGVGQIIPKNEIDLKLKKAFGFKRSQNAINNSRQPSVNNVQDVIKLINKLKHLGKGIPIGAKIAANKYLEQDLAILCRGKIDYIVVEGAEGGSVGSSPILEDDFGIPTVYAIGRANRWLRKQNLHRKVSLVACGKIRTPGDILKLVALGANACYIGSMALFATSHTQTLKPIPFEPPTQIAWYDGKFSNKFNTNKGAQSLARYLTSVQRELEQGVRALGKTKLWQVNKSDLMCLYEEMGHALDIETVY